MRRNCWLRVFERRYFLWLKNKVAREDRGELEMTLGTFVKNSLRLIKFACNCDIYHSLP